METTTNGVRRLCLVAAATAFLAVAAGGAQAQAWKPEKQVELIIGTKAGGPQDRTGRLIQKILQDEKLVSVPMTVVNRPGGGGALGLAYLNQHRGDGDFLMVNAISLLTNHITGKSALSYTDFTPIAVVGLEYVSLCVPANSPLKSAKDVVERLRKDPASLSVAIGTALGNATHLSLALAMKAAGVDIKRLRTVVFPSGSESVTAALGGHVDIAAIAPSGALSQVRAGKMRMLVISAPERQPGDLAAVPTWRDLGIDSSFALWRGLAGPGGMTRAQVAFWDGALAKVVQSPEWKQDLKRFDAADVYKNSAETAKYWKEQYGQVKEILTELGLAKK